MHFFYKTWYFGNCFFLLQYSLTHVIVHKPLKDSMEMVKSPTAQEGLYVIYATLEKIKHRNKHIRRCKKNIYLYIIHRKVQALTWKDSDKCMLNLSYLWEYIRNESSWQKKIREIIAYSPNVYSDICKNCKKKKS